MAWKWGCSKILKKPKLDNFRNRLIIYENIVVFRWVFGLYDHDRAECIFHKQKLVFFSWIMWISRYPYKVLGKWLGCFQILPFYTFLMITNKNTDQSTSIVLIVTNIFIILSKIQLMSDEIVLPKICMLGYQAHKLQE